MQKLIDNGTIEYLRKLYNKKDKNPFDSIPLVLFDNTDYENRPISQWSDLIDCSLPVGLPARVMRTFTVEEEVRIIWANAHVKLFNGETFDVIYDDPLPAFEEDELKFVDDEQKSEFDHSSISLERLFICFDAEDPINYCNRLRDTINRKKLQTATMALNLYVDCMPVDDLKGLDTEQTTRIISSAVNMVALRNNSLLDTSSIIQQYNLNHMRTLNMLTLANKLRHNLKEIELVHSYSVDPTLLEGDATTRKSAIGGYAIPEYNFPEKVQGFKFSSLWNRPEAIRIIAHMQNENYNLEKGNFFAVP